MATITIPKTEYDKLNRQAKAYRKIASRFFDWMLEDPIEEVVGDFRDSGLYSKEFLGDLDSGLRKSSYGKQQK